MKIFPANHILHWQQDPYSNFLARLLFPEKTRELTTEIDLVAELSPVNPFDYVLEPEAEKYPFKYAPSLARDLEPFLALQPASQLLRRFLEKVRWENARPTVGFLVDLNRRLRDQIGYVVRLEPGIQSCEETLSLGTGSCRDSAWLLVQILRHLGLASRFVSGYLIQLAPNETSLEAPAEATKDSVDLHAWAEVYLPGAGWIGFDPTSGLLAAEGHIPLA
jgi:transglutaminase-like putative cysteine protease